MHPLTYEVKRTHWNATWEAIRLYRAAGENWNEATLEDMTPARCDILQTVWDNNADWHGVRRAQGLEPGKRFMHLADVRGKLGLAGTTVWRCVQRLVELEWITLLPCEKRKRHLVVHLTELGIHALRMAQRCALADSIEVEEKPRAGFFRLVDDFVRRDAEAQGVLVPPEPSRPAPGRRSFRHWREYYWWLVGYLRTMAKHFGCKAGRLYHRTADGQVVLEGEDRWTGEAAPPRKVKPGAAASAPPPVLGEKPQDAWWRALIDAAELLDERFPT